MTLLCDSISVGPRHGVDLQEDYIFSRIKIKTDEIMKINFLLIIIAVTFLSCDTHFAFLQHDLKKGEDSSAVFVAGGGRYSLTGTTYTEHLEYCSARNWEGNDFSFNISIKGDTLIQRGVEKIENLGVNRVNIEKYVRVSKEE